MVRIGGVRVQRGRDNRRACIRESWVDDGFMETDKTTAPAASTIAVSVHAVRSIRGKALAADVRLVDTQWKVRRKSQRLGEIVDEPGRVTVELTGLYLESRQVTLQVRAGDSRAQFDLCAGETLVLDPVGTAAVEPSGWIERLRRDVRSNQNAGRQQKRLAHAAVKSLQACSAWF